MASAATDYDIRQVVRALRRSWWLVLAVPAIGLAIQALRIQTAPFRTEFRAVIVLPGDTEIPGSSERPELMIMDDVPTLVGSHLFAERVAAASGGMPVEEVDRALSATRYARTVTVVVRDDDRAVTERIAEAAQSALPGAVSEVLVVDGRQAATVTVIDPVGEVRRGEPGQWRATGVVMVVLLFVGSVAALALDGLGRPGAQSA